MSFARACVVCVCVGRSCVCAHTDGFASYQTTVERDSDTFSLVNTNHAQQKVLPVCVCTLAAHDYLVRTPGNDARYSFVVACLTVGEDQKTTRGARRLNLKADDDSEDEGLKTVRSTRRS